MNRTIIASLVITVLLASCKKETKVSSQNTNSVPPPAPNFLPLKLGNYWIYEAFTLDSLNTETDLAHTDSLYIDRDSIVGSKTYYHFSSVNPNSLFASFSVAGEWVIDSAGILCMQSGGWSLPDPTHLNDTLMTDTVTWGFVIYKVCVNFSSDITSAGTYSGISIDTKLHRLNPAHDYPRSVGYVRYTPGIGVAHFKGGFASDPMAGYAWKLVRYHI